MTLDPDRHLRTQPGIHNFGTLCQNDLGPWPTPQGPAVIPLTGIPPSLAAHHIALKVTITMVPEIAEVTEELLPNQLGGNYWTSLVTVFTGWLRHHPYGTPLPTFRMSMGMLHNSYTSHLLLCIYNYHYIILLYNIYLHDLQWPWSSNIMGCQPHMGIQYITWETGPNTWPYPTMAPDDYNTTLLDFPPGEQ
jgi:hypothetical protein